MDQEEKTGLKEIDKGRKRRRRRQDMVGYSFILPNFLGFFAFTLIPVFFSFGLSFCEWDSAHPISFVGMENFKRLLTDQTFHISLKNTLFYTVWTVPLTIVLSLGMALLLNQEIKGRVVFRSIFFFPYVASLVAICVVWNMLFNPDMGPVNCLLSALGVKELPRWTASVKWALPTVIGLSVWKGAGYYMIVYLAALQGVSREIYEAAVVDGAGGVKRFFAITLPMLTPTTFFVTMMLVISSFRVFDTIYIMTGGGPGRATNVLVYDIYNTAFVKFQFGYASAISMVLFLLVLIITLIQFRAEKKWVSYM